MKALVTGGGGFLGRYVVEALLARGDAVRVIGRRAYPEIEAQGAECRKVDLTDAKGILEACEGIDTVFHTAAKAGIWGDPQDYDRTNVLGTRNVIRACLSAGVPRLVHTSTPSVVAAACHLEGVNEDQPYPEEPLCDYQRTKIQAEREVLEANGQQDLATTALRPHVIFGPRDPHFVPRLIERSRTRQLRRVGDGTNLVDVIFVENAADAHIQAADRLTLDSPLAGSAYFLSQGEPVVLWDFLGRMLEGLGLPPPGGSVPFPLAHLAGHLLEWAYRTFSLSGEPRMTRFLAAELSHHHYFDISRARNDLGYEPKVSTEEGLERLFDYFRSEGLTRSPGVSS